MSLNEWDKMHVAKFSQKAERIGLHISQEEQHHFTNLVEALFRAEGTSLQCKKFTGPTGRAELNRLVDILVNRLPRYIADGTRHANLHRLNWAVIRRRIVRLKIMKTFGKLRRETRDVGYDKDKARVKTCSEGNDKSKDTRFLFHHNSIILKSTDSSIRLRHDTIKLVDFVQGPMTLNMRAKPKPSDFSLAKFIDLLSEAGVDLSKHKVTFSDIAGGAVQLQDMDNLAPVFDHICVESFPLKPKPTPKIFVSLQAPPLDPVNSTPTDEQQIDDAVPATLSQATDTPAPAVDKEKVSTSTTAPGFPISTPRSTPPVQSFKTSFTSHVQGNSFESKQTAVEDENGRVLERLLRERAARQLNVESKAE